jgi:Flp pilus assembly protein TadD
MKLIRWLLSNIILIAFILALTYAYVYWDNLTGPDTPAGKVIAVITDEFESVRDFVESYQPDTEADGHSDTTKTEAVAANQREAVSSTTMAEPVVQPAPAQPVPPVRQPAQPATRQVPPAATRSAPPVTTQQASVAPDKPVTRATAGMTEHQLWIAARTAFQNGQYEKSIGLYRDIIAANSDRFDAWGEMGNVYMRIGDSVQAGAAYYEAAAIMVRHGQPARARSVLPLLYRLDRNKARQLNELIQKPANRNGT